MATYFKTSVSISLASLKVLNQNKILLLIALVRIVLAISAAIFILSPAFDIYTNSFNDAEIKTQILLLFFLLIILFFVISHGLKSVSNALISTFLLRKFRSEPHGMVKIAKTVFSKLHHLIFLGLMNGTIPPIMWILESWVDDWENKKFIKSKLHGLKWRNASLLINPLMADSNIPPLKAATKSAELVKATWGKNIIPHISPEAYYMLTYVVLLMPFIFSAYFFNDITTIRVGFFFSISLILLVSIIKSTIQIVTLTATYLYAAGDTRITQAYPKELLQNAFFVKK